MRKRLAALAILLYLGIASAGLLLEAANGGNVLVSGWVLFAFLWEAVIGWLIVRRHPAHPIGWIFSASALLYGLTHLSQNYAVRAALSGEALPGRELAAWLGFWLLIPVIAALGFFLPLLFPDGRLASARWRPVAWMAGGLAVVGALYAMLVPASYEAAGFPTIRNPTGIAPDSTVIELIGIAVNGLFLGLALVCMWSVFERGRSADAEVRLQVKWFSYAAVLIFLSFVVGVMSETFSGLNALDEAVSAIAVTALPTAVGVAILRYRLYEIDLLINRTLVYGALTAILAGVYTASIALFQRLFVATTGQGSDLAIVLAIFVLATTFTPLRNRLQTGVDRRYKPAVASDAPALADVFGDIERLAELHRRGVLTDDEFAAKKRQLLGI